MPTAPPRGKYPTVSSARETAEILASICRRIAFRHTLTGWPYQRIAERSEMSTVGVQRWVARIGQGVSTVGAVFISLGDKPQEGVPTIAQGVRVGQDGMVDEGPRLITLVRMAYGVATTPEWLVFGVGPRPPGDRAFTAREQIKHAVRTRHELREWYLQQEGASDVSNKRELDGMVQKTRQAFVDRAEARRVRCGLSWPAVDRASGLSRTSFKNTLANATSGPTLGTMVRLAHAFGVKPEWLMFGVGEEPDVLPEPKPFKTYED